MILVQIHVLFALVMGAVSQQLTTPEQRAQCQCSADGRSGGQDVFYFSRWRKTYKSENIEFGGSYKFIGCGAHKHYRDKAENQIGGYPWRFCYTYGGQNACRITTTSQKHSLNKQIAYRFCNGDYNCQVQAHTYVDNGTIAELKVFNETDPEGLLQDWTNCCRECRLSQKECVAWDFDVETMECRLFSSVESIATKEGDTHAAPFHFSGTAGFDDAPAACWFRNKYDTCKDNFRPMFIASMVLLSFGVFFMAYECLVTRRLLATMGWSTDVTPTYRRQIPKTRSTKHGTTHYSITKWFADLVYQFQGTMCRESVGLEGQEIHENKKFFFTKINGTLKPIGHRVPRNTFGFCGYLFFLAAAILLLIISLQVYLSDGGRFQAKYVLPSGNEETWTAVFYLVSVVAGLSPFMFVILVTAQGKGYFVKRENTQSVPNVSAQKEGA